MNVFKKFPRLFWIANSIELIERAAWYGLFNVLALYLTNSTDTGALGFTQAQKGNIMGIVSAFVYFLPFFFGTISDRIGYKKTLVIGFALYIVGFSLMRHASGYSNVFLAFAVVGIGAALFKPIVAATISKTTNEKNTSQGFGIYYMMVNLGALIGPVVTSKLRQVSWDYVFYFAIFAISFNLVFVLLMFKEPEKIQNNEPLGVSIKNIFKKIFTVFTDWKFLIFLLIVVGFWTMYMQLFFTLPVFVDQWIDTTRIYNSLANLSPHLASAIGTPQGTIAPEMILNVDALYITLFQLIVSTVVMKWKPLNSMISGIFVAGIGLGLTFMFNNPFFIFLAILIFSLGEMASSPKITEYIGLIASKDRKALYMGMSFLPVAGGNFLGGKLSGSVYSKTTDKLNLLKKDFINRGWEVPEINENFTKNDFLNFAAEKMNFSQSQLTEYLWNTYNPQKIWIIFTAIGMTTVILLYLYDKIILKSKK